MNMKVLFLTFTIILILKNITYSQCSYTRNETDEFTKKTILETTKVVVKSRDLTGQALRFFGCKQNTSRFLKVNWNTLDIVSVSSGDKLMLKLINDEVLEIYSNDYKVSSPIGNYWTITIYYYIDENTFQKLKENQVVKLRFYTDEGYVDKEVSKGASNSILQMFKCID